MANVICERCGHVGRPRRQRQGAFAVELVLWVLFCLPGAVYSFWRWLAFTEHCRGCGCGVVQLSSPRGYQLFAYYYPGQQLPPP